MRLIIALKRDFLRAPVLLCKMPFDTARSIFENASLRALAVSSGLAALAASSTRFLAERTNDFQARLRTRLRSVIWTRLIADLILGTVLFFQGLKCCKRQSIVARALIGFERIRILALSKGNVRNRCQRPPRRQSPCLAFVHSLSKRAEHRAPLVLGYQAIAQLDFSELIHKLLYAATRLLEWLSQFC
jgi:hypothetical protein